MNKEGLITKELEGWGAGLWIENYEEEASGVGNLGNLVNRILAESRQA